MFYLVYLFVAIERPDVGCTGSVRDVATAASGLCAEQLTVPRNTAARAPLLAPSALCSARFPRLSEALSPAWGRAPPSAVRHRSFFWLPVIAALLFLGNAVTPVYGCATPIGSVPPTMVVLLRLVTEVGSLLQLAAPHIFPSDWLWGSRRVLCGPVVPQQALSRRRG
jgi:hypothetical protein